MSGATAPADEPALSSAANPARVTGVVGFFAIVTLAVYLMS